MFAPRIRVTATAVPGLSRVRDRLAKPRGAPTPHRIAGTVNRLNGARGGIL
jgi:hypothetical protein